MELRSENVDGMKSENGASDRDAPTGQSSPWLTVKEAAKRARCGPKLIYREVRAKRLRAARVGGRRELRFLPEWIDAWLITHSTIQEERV